MSPSFLSDAGFRAVVLYRLANALKRRRVPVLPPLVARLAILVTGADIAPAAEIGPGLVIRGGRGLVIGFRARIGRDVELASRVTIGAPGVTRREEMPVIGDGAVLAEGAAVIGAVEVGPGAQIGPDCLVTRNVPAGGRAYRKK